jgi:hypothetical protein
VATRLVPHLYDDIGLAAPVLAIAGFVAFWGLERRDAHLARVGTAIVLPALVVHSVLDGAALALAFGEHMGRGATIMLGAALVVHRLPEGLFVGATFVPRIGIRRTFKRVGVLASGTIVGALGGQELVARVPSTWLHGLVAIGLGVMVHLISHRHATSKSTEDGRAGALAFAVGVAVALLVPSPGDMLFRAQPHEFPIGRSLGPLFVKTSPAVAIGFGIAVGSRWLRQKLAAKAGRALPILTHHPWDVASGGPINLAGLPVVDPISATLSLALFGMPMTAVRLIGCAVAAACLWGGQLLVRPKRGDPDESSSSAGKALRPAESPAHCPKAAVSGDLGRAAFDCIDRVGPSYVFGLLLATVVEAALPRNALADAPAGVLVIGLVGLAAPFGLAPEALLPVLFILTHKGLGSAGLAAVSVAGLVLSFATVASIRARGGAAGVGGLLLVAMGSSVLAAALARGLDIAVPAAHPFMLRPAGLLEWACAVIVSGVLAASLLRMGPRSFWRAAFRIARRGSTAPV